MNHDEALRHAINVKWKTTDCGANDGNCWCAIVEPEEKIVDDDGNEIYIIHAGSVSKEMAKHIVDAHNKSLKPSSKKFTK